MNDFRQNHNNNSIQSYNSEVERTLELVMQGQTVAINSYNSEKLEAANDNDPLLEG